MCERCWFLVLCEGVRTSAIISNCCCSSIWKGLLDRLWTIWSPSFCSEKEYLQVETLDTVASLSRKTWPFKLSHHTTAVLGMHLLLTEIMNREWSTPCTNKPFLSEAYGFRQCICLTPANTKQIHRMRRSTALPGFCVNVRPGKCLCQIIVAAEISRCKDLWGLFIIKAKSRVGGGYPECCSETGALEKMLLSCSFCQGVILYGYTPGQVNGSVTVLKYQLSIISCRNIFQEMCNVMQKLMFGEAQVPQRGCENHKTDSHPLFCEVLCWNHDFSFLIIAI